MRERPSGSFWIGNRPSFIVALGRQYQRPRMNLCRTASGILAVGCLLALTPAVGHSAATENDNKTLYDYSLVAFDGKEAPLSMFKDKVVLVVNLASKSIFKEQIPQLEELQKKYKDQGLVVVGVPCNDFGAQEPGTDAEVQKTYSSDFHLGFPVFARTSARGKDQAALYAFLTTDKKGPTGGEVHWSYTKFIVDRGGKVVARFEPYA